MALAGAGADDGLAELPDAVAGDGAGPRGPGGRQGSGEGHHLPTWEQKKSASSTSA